MADIDIISALYSRRQIRVSKIIVHENFTDGGNDIALLRLGKKVHAGLLHISMHRRESGSICRQPCLSS